MCDQKEDGEREVEPRMMDDNCKGCDEENPVPGYGESVKVWEGSYHVSGLDLTPQESVVRRNKEVK